MNATKPPSLLAACLGGGFALLILAGLVIGAFERLTS
jgi:hypothetical protein